MGFFRRVPGRDGDGQGPTRTAGARRAPGRAAATILGGHETLEVVGESFCQDALWRIVGGRRSERVRCSIVAVLRPEPSNRSDEYAVRVLVDGVPVGYLAHEDARAYLPGLASLSARHGGPIALRGAIVGGGRRGNAFGMLGVFLDHDPADFGLTAHEATHVRRLRTGLSQALATDLDDDRYDLSWLGRVSGMQPPHAIVELRRLLVEEEEPIDRHFMYCELEDRLYQCRDAFASALGEFDAACALHDAEMPAIRAALLEKFGAIPVIELYRRAAIRCQKACDWPGARAWAERGLEVYGSDAARPEAVEDLHKRLAHAIAKAAGPAPQAPAPTP